MPVSTSVPLPRTATASTGRGPARSRKRQAPPSRGGGPCHLWGAYLAGAADLRGGLKRAVAEPQDPGPCQPVSAPSLQLQLELELLKVAAAEETRPADRPKVQF